MEAMRPTALALAEGMTIVTIRDFLSGGVASSLVAVKAREAAGAIDVVPNAGAK